MSTLSTYFVLPDGAKIAYQVLNLTSDHEDTEKTPLVMVNGLNSLGQDFKKLSEEIAKGRPGELT